MIVINTSSFDIEDDEEIACCFSRLSLNYLQSTAGCCSECIERSDRQRQEWRARIYWLLPREGAHTEGTFRHHHGESVASRECSALLSRNLFLMIRMMERRQRSLRSSPSSNTTISRARAFPSIGATQWTPQPTPVDPLTSYTTTMARTWTTASGFDLE